MPLNTGGGLPLSPRPLKPMVAALALGLVIGALAAGLPVVFSPPAAAMEDYVLLVSAAYARERLLANAVERLAAAGVSDVTRTVSLVAKDFRARHPDRARDTANVEQLAAALAAQPAAKEPDGIGWWPIAAALAFIVVGIGVARSRRRKADFTLRALPRVETPHLEKAGVMGGLRAVPLEDLAGGTPYGTGAIRAGQGEAPHPPRIRRLTTVPGKRREVVLRTLMCAYHAGDEPFEDVHPIAHEDDDTLLGACGLTAAGKLEAYSPARYYAFTAWVHDYLSGEPMCAIGLLSPWATGRRHISLLDPSLTRATLHRAEKGLVATIETENMRVTAVVADVGYGMARDVPANSYFTILSVKFTITIK